MNYLIYLGHPAHYHLFKNSMAGLQAKGHQILVVYKTKDILEDLLKKSDWPHINIMPGGRKDGLLSIGSGLLVRDKRMLSVVRRFRPNLMAGTSAEIAHIGWLLRIPSIVVNEDDAEAVPLFAKTAYPFATHILAPSCCSVGRWKAKAILYEGYHELAYLHPRNFRVSGDPVPGLPASRYFVVRFAKLTAHHDSGKTGITSEIARQVIARLEPHGRVLITSERALESEFEPYRIRVDPSDMHQVLARADMLVADSQTMTAEAAVLGTPALRFNDFVGKIGYLEELEHRYGLTVGVPTSEPGRLYEIIGSWLANPGLKREWGEKREAMLKEKIVVSEFMTWLFEEYPSSAREAMENPQLWDRFR